MVRSWTCHKSTYIHEDELIESTLEIFNNSSGTLTPVFAIFYVPTPASASSSLGIYTDMNL